MEELFTTRDGRVVRIQIDDVDFSVEVTVVASGEEIGTLEFHEIEMDSRAPSVLRFTSAFLEGPDGSYRRQGIGRRCLQLIREISDMEIVAADDDGQRRDDGSHLTGDAPAFVTRMREEGLIR